MIKEDEWIYVGRREQPSGCVWVSSSKLEPEEKSCASAWLVEKIGPEHSGWHSTGHAMRGVTTGWMIRDHADALAFKLKFGL